MFPLEFLTESDVQSTSEISMECWTLSRKATEAFAARDYSRAFDIYDKAVAHASNAADADLLTAMISNSAAMHIELGDIAVAIEQLEHHSPCIPLVPPSVASCALLSNLGIAYGIAGRLDDSSSTLESALKMMQELDSEKVVELRDRIYLGLANGNLQKGDLQKSKFLYKEILERNFSSSFEMFFFSLHGLGIVYLRMGQFEQAQAVFEEVYKRSMTVGFQQGIACSLGSIACIYLHRGQFFVASVMIRNQLAVLSENPDKVSELTARESLSIALEKIGSRAEAKAERETAAQIRQSIGGEILDLQSGVNQNLRDPLSLNVNELVRLKELYEKNGNKSGAARLLDNLAVRLVHLSHQEKDLKAIRLLELAVRVFEESLAAVVELGELYGVSETKLNLGGTIAQLITRQRTATFDAARRLEVDPWVSRANELLRESYAIASSMSCHDTAYMCAHNLMLLCAKFDPDSASQWLRNSHIHKFMQYATQAVLLDQLGEDQRHEFWNLYNQSLVELCKLSNLFRDHGEPISFSRLVTDEFRIQQQEIGKIRFANCRVRQIIIEDSVIENVSFENSYVSEFKIFPASSLRDVTIHNSVVYSSADVCSLASVGDSSYIFDADDNSLQAFQAEHDWVDRQMHKAPASNGSDKDVFQLFQPFASERRAELQLLVDTLVRPYIRGELSGEAKARYEMIDGLIDKYMDIEIGDSDEFSVLRLREASQALPSQRVERFLRRIGLQP